MCVCVEARLYCSRCCVRAGAYSFTLLLFLSFTLPFSCPPSPPWHLACPVAQWNTWKDARIELRGTVGAQFRTMYGSSDAFVHAMPYKAIMRALGRM